MKARLTRSKKYAATAALSLSLLGLALSGCGGNNEPTLAPTETAIETASPEPTETPAPTPTASFIAPLTGMSVEQTVTNRPFAVLINNLAPARPQSGLTHADTVWELLAEGGITRLVAVFQSDNFADPIGPVRSIRPYFLEVGEFYNSILVHVGASNDCLAILQKYKKQTLDEINNAGAYFYRDKTRKPPHNVYTTLEKLREGAEKRKYDATYTLPELKFDPAPPAIATGEPAQKIDIKFMLKDYKVSYAYDAGTSKYQRFINDKPHVDKNNDQQLTATNLVVLGAKYVTYDAVGRLELDLEHGGDAVLFQQGKAIPCKWERKKGDIVRLVKDGQELPFLPGVTYYHVVPNAKALSSYVTYQ